MHTWRIHWPTGKMKQIVTATPGAGYYVNMKLNKDRKMFGQTYYSVFTNFLCCDNPEGQEIRDIMPSYRTRHTSDAVSFFDDDCMVVVGGYYCASHSIVRYNYDNGYKPTTPVTFKGGDQNDVESLFPGRGNTLYYITRVDGPAKQKLYKCNPWQDGPEPPSVFVTEIPNNYPHFHVRKKMVGIDKWGQTHICLVGHQNNKGWNAHPQHLHYVLLRDEPKQYGQTNAEVVWGYGKLSHVEVWGTQKQAADQTLHLEWHRPTNSFVLTCLCRIDENRLLSTFVTSWQIHTAVQNKYDKCLINSIPQLQGLPLDLLNEITSFAWCSKVAGFHFPTTLANVEAAVLAD
eukprot:TRINITY_DN67800_c4_g1_i1.p1 TRINITY_DN67800_c4_g1~~TRINITY_DN67800_c4_g1_i1.p1  ORF type:complete len:360 (+),score=18.70 TRINITY_DN67800_c4_g1_i1:46-1080(+)